MFKKYQLPIISMGLLSLATLVLVITRMSPCLEYGSNQICTQISITNHLFFYLSLAILVACLFTSFTFFLRSRNADKEKLNHYFNTSLRQGTLVSLFTTVSVFFLSLNILKWWTTLVLLILIVLVEFISLQKRSF